MTLLKPALIAAAIAVAAPAFANGFSAIPIMPTLTYPQDGAFEPATKNQTKLVETCTEKKDACTMVIDAPSHTLKTSGGQ